MEPLLPIKALAFDCFGTLVEIQSPAHVYRDIIGRMPKHFQPAAKQAVMTHAWSLAETVDQLGAAFAPDEIEELSSRLADELSSIACFPETVEVLTELRKRGYQIALCSNLALPYAAPVEALLGPLLDVKVWSYAAGAIKPEVRIYRSLCESLQLAPEQVLMIGDSQRADFTGARGAGLHARHLTRNVPDHRLALHRIASLADVLRLVR